ncbi:hypothetical protein ONZ45_g5864 [Pleurotus djamor]|nr:hypothetical protein ONZ45_g5864 [Pleurotus djamor]
MPHPRLFKVLAKLALRRVASSEETEEILGIVEETGIQRHLVVAYNTFLDIMSGCVSGGVRVPDAGFDGKSEGVVHFRGLDWEMEQLRPLTICVEYVRNGQVVARSVTYAGYTGVLTGVRPLNITELPHENALNLIVHLAPHPPTPSPPRSSPLDIITPP